jgi:23S rRNA (adenine2030-N6)-methyltransferase
VNPHWQLKSELEELLPCIKDNLGKENSKFTLKQLIAE